ncbi:MAG TPA: fibronectin type III domain-containing protein [Clostridia bacterium]|nr:fibronectin type III domain-containing protein [Clostridia bacterium]
MKNKRISAGICAAALAVLLALCSPAEGFAAADTQPPSAPRGLTVTGKTHTSISLSWSASHDNLKVKGYQIFRDGKKTSTASKTAYTSSNLVPGVQYEFSVRAYDAAGNISDSSTVITASTTSDTQEPSAPGELRAAAPGYTSVALSWKQSTDNVGIKGYEIYCNDKKAASTSDTFYEYKKLTPGMSYTFYVRARDKADNYSSQSNTVSVSTPADRAAPSVPEGLKASSVSVSEIGLTWSPASDNVAVKGYDIIRDGTRIGTTTKTSYSSKGLFPGKAYTYTIRASDISGNQSAGSKPLKVATSGDSQAPAPPSELKITAVNGASVTLAWSAATDNGKVAGYQIYCNDIVIATSVSASRVLKLPFGPGRYELWIKAFDQSGNLSDSSNTVTADIAPE